MEREISIILKVKGAKAAKDAVQDVFNQQTVTLVKGFNQATKKTGDNMERIRRTSKQASVGVQSFTKTLGRSLSVLYLYNRAWATFGSQFEEGLQLDRASQQFEKNVGSVSKMLPELRTATKGVVADFDLLKTAGRAVQQGLKADQLPQAFKMATIASQRLGLSTTDSINTITQAITRQDEGALNTLGIITNVNQAYKTQAALIAKNGGVMSQAMSIQLRQSLIMQELQKRFGGANKAQEDGLMVLERFRASWKNFRAEVGQTLGIALIPLTKALTGVLDVMTRVLNKANETQAFQKFVQVAATLGGIFAGYKLYTSVKNLLNLFRLFKGNSGPVAAATKSIQGFVVGLNMLKAVGGTKKEMGLLALKSGIGGIWDVTKNLLGTGFKLAKWGMWFQVAGLFIEPLSRAFSKLWQIGKVFFQLISNYDSETGLSKVLKQDADALGGMYNGVENLAKTFLKLQAIVGGFVDGLGAVFKPIGYVINWATDQVGTFIEGLLGIERTAAVARSELESLARAAKIVGGVAGGALTGFMLGGLPGAIAGGALGGGAAALSDVDFEAVNKMMPARQTNWAGNSGYIAPQPQAMSTQVTTPEARPQNLDYGMETPLWAEKMIKELQGQTDIMETEIQNQAIEKSQNNARSNIWTRR